MVIFDTVQALKEAVLESGQRADAKGYYAAGDVGCLSYLIKTPLEYGGAPNEYSDFTLANGNIAVLQYKKVVDARYFGAKGDGIADDTASIQAALDTGLSVFLPPGIYLISNISVPFDNQELYGITGSILQGYNTIDSTPMVEVSGDFANISELRIYPKNTLSPALETKGFRNKVQNCFISATAVSGGGCLNCLKVSAKETIVLYGVFKGASDSEGSGGSAGAGIYVHNADLSLINPYVEQNRHGVYTSGLGSINGFHVHSFNNSKSGFYLSGASFSQLVGCYADTSGEAGFTIRDINYGLALINCWSYKSSNLLAGSSDFAFTNARGIKLIGCLSNGNGAFTKGYSYNFGSDCHVVLTDCYGEISPNNVIGTSFLSGCTGKLAKYNSGNSTSISTSYTISGSGNSNVEVPTRFSEGFSSPGFISFEVFLSYRNTSGTDIGVEKFIVSVASGGPSTTIESIHPSSPTLDILSASYTVGANLNYVLTLNVQNNNAFSAQISASAHIIGTGRGFN